MTAAKEKVLSAFHVMDRASNRHVITAEQMTTDGEQVVLWDGSQEVASFLSPLSVHRGASVTPAAEPLLAIGSAFLSSPVQSPLVEAIESLGRLLVDAQGQGDAHRVCGAPGERLPVFGLLAQHLETLCIEQCHQLCALPPRMVRNG